MRNALAAAILLTSCSYEAAADNVHDAVEFMLTGDNGYAGFGITDVINVDCTTSYKRDFGGTLRIAITYNWRNVIWASAANQASIAACVRWPRALRFSGVRRDGIIPPPGSSHQSPVDGQSL